MEDYQKIEKQEALGSYFYLKMIAELAPQKIFQRNIWILEVWKPTRDMKFRFDFFFTWSSTYELETI